MSVLTERDRPSPLALPSLATLNITSTRQYTQDRHIPAKKIQRLLLSTDISGFQETRLSALDDGRNTAYSSATHTSFFSNNPANTTYADTRHYTAGIATVIKSSFLASYSSSLISLHPSLQGHALALYLQPKHPGRSLLIINLRLDAFCHDARNAQVRTLLNHPDHPLPPSDYTIAFGDFNFVDEADDSTSGGSLAGRPAKWSIAMNQLHLHDVHTNCHTYFHNNEPR